MHRPVLLGGILLVYLCTQAAPAPAADRNWPRFRGPNGAGVAADKDIPVKWTEQNILWKVEIPGLGNSSPVIWGDRLFLQSASKDGTERSLYCLSSVDGKTLWHTSVAGAAVPKGAVHPKNSLASSTPAVDGERVYALFWDSKHVHLYGYDLEGKQLWQRDLGPFKSQHGPGTSPMAYDGKVYVANDQDGAAELIAFDGKTGKDAWRAQRTPFRACYSVPFLVEKPDASKELILGSTAGITSYDPTTGRENWNWTSWPWLKMPLRTVASPIYTNGMFVINSGDGSGERNTTAIRPAGKGNLTPEVIAWSKTKVFPYVPNMLARGDHIYYVNDLGIASCVLTRTGETIWEERLGGNFSASPILIDEKIYATSEDGMVYVFPAAPKFERLAKNVLDEGVIATPAVADHRLYIRGRTHLFCIGQAPATSR